MRANDFEPWLFLLRRRVAKDAQLGVVNHAVRHCVDILKGEVGQVSVFRLHAGENERPFRIRQCRESGINGSGTVSFVCEIKSELTPTRPLTAHRRLTFNHF